MISGLFWGFTDGILMGSDGFLFIEQVGGARTPAIRL
jgi:hypothetical protein